MSEDKKSIAVSTSGCSSLLTVVVVVLIAIFFVLLFGRIDSFISIVIVLISLCLIAFSFISIRYRIILRLTSIFLIFHLIVFPLIYLNQLKKNPKSFEFDNYIKSIEKEKALLDVRMSFNPDLAESKKEIVDELLSTNSMILKESIGVLENNDIQFVGKYLIYSKSREQRVIIDDEISHPSKEMQHRDLLIICDTNGRYINQLVNFESFTFGQDERTIEAFLKDKKRFIENDIIDYSNLKNAIQQEDRFWTYGKIFPYVLNVFNTDNIKPKSRKANLIFFLHYVVIGIFVISLLANSMDSLIKRKKKVN